MRSDRFDIAAAAGELARPLLRHLADVIFRVSRDGIFVEHIPTQGRRLGVFADPIEGCPIEQVLPGEQAEETARCLARALRSGEMQALDYTVWEGEERHILEGRLVATSDREALLLLLDATERRALVAASEAIVDVSHVLQTERPLDEMCNEIVTILAERLEYPALRVSLRHPTLRGATLEAIYGDADVHEAALIEAARAVGVSARYEAQVGLAAAAPIIRGEELCGVISVSDTRPRTLHAATLSTLESVAASLANARDRDRAELTLAEQVRAVDAYEQTGRLLADTLDLDEVLDALSHRVVEAGVFRSLMVALVDPRGEQIEVVRDLARGTDGSIRLREASGIVYRLDDENITAEVARTGVMQVVRGWDDRYDDRLSTPANYSKRRVAYFVPVKKGDRVLAVIATGSQADEEQDTLQRIEDMEPLLTQMAVALDHAQLYRQTQEARKEMRTIMIGARCLLWHATVERWEMDGGAWTHFEWDIRMFDEGSAQRFMPLDLQDQDTYEIAWLASKVDEDLQPMHDVATAALIEESEGYSQEFRCVDKNGLTRWLFEDVHIEAAGPDRWRLVGVCTDVTERKQVDEMKEEFISTVSHELRTPLTSILGALELVLGGSTGELPERSLPLLTIARDNGRRLTRLVNDILDIDKIEFGRIEFDMQTMELAPLIDAAMEANRPFAESVDVQLVFEGPVDGVQVDVDPGRFAQLMANLLSNAAKFSPAGERVSVTMSVTDGWARVSVADNGPGIPEDAFGTLFDRFTQVDGSSTRTHPGTGLGLAVAKAIVGRLRGRIDLTSEVGVGTTFFFDLRARVAPGDASTTATVCICADDSAIAGTLRDPIAANGHHVVLLVEPGHLPSAEEIRGRAIVIDARADGAGPTDLLRRLRVHAHLRHAPVISAVVHQAGSDDLAAGAFYLLDHLPRPLDAARLLAVTSDVASRRNAAVPLILHVGADVELARITGRALGQFSGVAHAADVQRARRLMDQHGVDVALLDMALPSEDRSAFLDSVGDTPVVLLGTQRDGDGAGPTLDQCTHPDGAQRIAALVESALAW
jgi:GAF domain-containing protein/DNA-binding response OmpR family regulator